MPLRLRLIWLLSVLVVVVAGAAVVVNLALGHVESNRALVSTRLQPAGLQSRSLLVALVDQETGQRGFVLTGDESFLKPYRDGYAALQSTLARLRSDSRGNAEMTAAVDEVEDAVETWRRVGATPEITARRVGDVRRAEALVRSGRGKVSFDAVRGRVAALQQIIDTRTERARRDDRADLSRLRTAVNLGRGMIVVILLAGAVLVRRWVLGPVTRLRARLQIVAGGRFDQEVLVDGPPEVAAIARDAESMRRRIVAELEATRAANDALSQHSPVVAALRGELASRARADTGGLDISGMVQPAEGVLAGDWWEAVSRPDGSTALILTDVSGHGAEAGLVAFAFKHRITALLGTDLDLGVAFTLASRMPDGDDERFLSCLVVVVDRAAGQLSWINAGHPPGLVVGRDSRDTVTELVPTGPLISSVTSGWWVSRAPFSADDLLVACTDGVLEARDDGGREFGETGLLDVVRRLRTWSAEQAVADCHEAVRRFAADIRRDDITCVALTLSHGTGA